MKQFGSFALDTTNECLWHEGAQIALASKPFSVLRYLVGNPGRLITHDELLDALWPETYVQPQVLRTYVLELRKILNDDAREPRFIQTIPKRGYSFIAAVEEKHPARGTDGIASPNQSAGDFFGRENELLRLQTAALQAAAGRRQVVFITGETGIGKTSLVQAFRDASSQTCMAYGHCVEGLSEKEPYYAVLEALGHCFTSAANDKPDSEQARLRSIQDRPGELCEALEGFAQEKLFVLVIEDIQWAHEATLELVSALARRSTPARLLIIATCRPQHYSAKHHLKAIKQDLVVRQLCTELALEPLSKQSVRRLLASRLEQEDMPAQLDDFVYRRSGGNPLFAHALVDHLIAEQLIARKSNGGEEKWEQVAPLSDIGVTVPHQLGRLIELEIDLLSPHEQRVLEAGSLMNIAFPVWAVAAALDENPERVEEICDALERRTGLVRRAGHDDLPNGTRSDFYTFAHGFYHEVLYRRQTASRRAKGHVRIANKLKALFAGREAVVAREVADHFEAAGHWQCTISALRSGALHSRDRFAHQESTQLLNHALRVAGNLGEPERGSLAREIEAELDSLRELVASTRSQEPKTS